MTRMMGVLGAVLGEALGAGYTGGGRGIILGWGIDTRRTISRTISRTNRRVAEGKEGGGEMIACVFDITKREGRGLGKEHNIFFVLVGWRE